MRPSRFLALVLLLLAPSLSFGEEAPPVAEAAPEPKPVVSDLRKLTSWHGRWYTTAGTSLLATTVSGDWAEVAALPDRVAAVAAAEGSLAAAGRGFLWVKPRGKSATPTLYELDGDWVALTPDANGWIALSSRGELAEFSSATPPRRFAAAGEGRFSDFTRAWDQWWLVGHHQGQALILTATALGGPWTEASPGGKAPLVRIASVRGTLLVFSADGRVYRAIEGEPWQPVTTAYESGGLPPLHLAANDEEGLVTLSPDALRQTMDGLHWNVLPYPTDEYASRALVLSDYGIVIAALPPTERQKPLLLEPSTPYSAFHLGQAYAAGDGVPLEPGHAVVLYRQAAEAGYDRAKLELAFLIASEQVKEADPTEASSLFLELCDEPASRLRPAEALDRLERKALAGHGRSQGVVAVLHRLGFGCKADSLEATAWMLLAEEKNANLYDLSWYRDADDDAALAEKRAAALRAKMR